MSRLTDLELHSIYSKAFSEKSSEGIVTACFAALRAIESAATEPLLQRIAELEQNNRDLSDDVQRFRKHAMNEKAARIELERQLEEARKDAERWLWWRKRWSAMCTESCARRAGIDLSNVYVQSPEQMDFVTDAAMQKGQS